VGEKNTARDTSPALRDSQTPASAPNENGERARQLREFVRRGHQIAQHGYNHRCPFTGRTDFEFYAPDATGWTRERRIETILEGRRLLEAAIGKKVVSYIAPGGDREYMQDDEKELLRQGYVDVPRARSAAEGGGWSPAGYGVCMDAVEFTWGLTEENYRENMEGAKNHFLQAAAEGRREVAIKFHDHFTRAAWNNGVTIRWLDEFLDWLTSQQTAADVRFATFEEYYQLKNPSFRRVLTARMESVDEKAHAVQTAVLYFVWFSGDFCSLSVCWNGVGAGGPAGNGRGY
jgi:peptidoglycan/xylan/chitin deacetylase (PgdA/CDA1 family)